MRIPVYLTTTLLALSINSSSQQGTINLPKSPAAVGFEFRGLKTGMSQKDVESALGVKVECINTDSSVNVRNSGWMCSNPADREFYVALSSMGKVWSINYHFQSGVTESPEAFAAAFSAKYGKPAIEKKSYRNGIGNEVLGVEYTWHHGTQELKIEELCGSLEESCLRITDTAYGPKFKTPQI